MKDLPEALARALTPLWNQFPRQSSLDRLVVSGPPPAAAAGSVETVLEDEALAAPVLQAALWLYADDLDRSHRICQQIDDATGSFWHGIMHRREGDFDNSRYWFNKVGDHPAISRIGYDPGISSAPSRSGTQRLPRISWPCSGGSGRPCSPGALRSTGDERHAAGELHAAQEVARAPGRQLGHRTAGRP